MKVAGKIGVILGMAMLMEGMSMSYGKIGTERSSTPTSQKNGRKLIFEIGNGKNLYEFTTDYGNVKVYADTEKNSYKQLKKPMMIIDVITGTSNTSYTGLFYYFQFEDGSPCCKKTTL
jgi:hypothetical protein